MVTLTFRKGPCFNQYGEQVTSCHKVDRRMQSEDRKEWEARDAELARLKSENARLMLQRDRLDCSVREGVGTYHCDVKTPCAACVMRAEVARLKGEVAVLERALELACFCDGGGRPYKDMYVKKARKELEGDNVQP